MTFRSVRLTFHLVAFVVIGLTLCAPYISRGDEQEPHPQNGQDESDQQLENMLQDLGVGPDADESGDADESWTDFFTRPFQDSGEDASEREDVDATPPALNENPVDPIDPETDTLDETNVDPTAAETKSDIGNRETPVGIDRNNSTPSALDSPSPTVDTTDPDSAEEPALLSAMSLDDLVRQTKQTPHLQQEAIHARLEDRRRLAIALRTTLEAAEHVAGYGKAGAQLLQDASLDTIVATMIAEKERERREQFEPSSPPPASIAPVSPVLPEEPELESATGFDAWRLVYVVRDSKGHRIGWRHHATGERLTTYVGETSVFDGDTVTIVGISTDERGRFLILDINDERHEIHLF